ncbi:MAG: sulfotransferase family protein [Caulobacteraceae bacterium]|nr:sulfotransferase family protein [Caulobacteraceae bacterium]
MGQARDDPEQRAADRFLQLIIAEQTFAGDYGEANVIATFERHNAEVRRHIPPERLLVFEVAQGWEPLCAFLGVPVPHTPFPRTNSREEFWRHTLPPERRDAAAAPAG